MARIHLEQFTTQEMKDPEKFRLKLNETLRKITDSLNYVDFGTPETSGVQAGQFDGVYISWMTSAAGTISHPLKRIPVGCIPVCGYPTSVSITSATSATVTLACGAAARPQYMLLF